jgi:hypothetical protein
MGYDLVSDHGEVGFNNTGWSTVLSHAIEYGWKPEPDLDYYFGNDYQKVTDHDARNLGEALLRGVAVLEARECANPTKWPDDWLRRVKKFGEFAQKGGFEIW